MNVIDMYLQAWAWTFQGVEQDSTLLGWKTLPVKLKLKVSFEEYSFEYYNWSWWIEFPSNRPVLMGINASKESQVKVKMKVKVTILHRLVFSSFVQALQEGQGSGMPSCQKPSGRELSQMADCQKEKIKFARKTFQDF